MKGLIYKITNKVNKKAYIGQTRYTVEFRWKQHQFKKDKTYFHQAIHKYGINNFTVEILEICNIEDLNSKEIFYIGKYDTFKNGYNLTIGGDGNRRLLLDDSYNEIKELYLSGFSSNKIATLYKIDKATVVKILKSLDVKIRNNKLDINNQEFQELVKDYKTGHSLKSLSKRYNCSAVALKDFLIRKGVDLRIKYDILKDKDAQLALINDYLDGILKYSEIVSKYHCSNLTFSKILSIHGISLKGKGTHFKISDKDCLQVIKLFNEGNDVQKIANKFEVNKSTIYSLLKRHGINY